ncbi:P27 family phage terminase small subunit [Faecalibaculum rodentium]|uniref:P27 family phage terminase small subunit n=1 Tax=Faecalibaculum rodentium TaxID=1702221 RepID=UPI0025A64DC4|nr:P27 family phage terminase small subunit [Faecalibaculum rodentium]
MKAKTKEYYKKLVVKAMTELGIYRPQFDQQIEQLAMIYHMRDLNLQQWEETDNFAQFIPYTNKAGATNISKHPAYLNNLQYGEQILKYLKELGLTPSSAKKLNISLDTESDDFEEFAT